MIYQKTNSSILILFILFLGFQNTEAQERQLLQGQIIVDSIQNASGVHVINLNAETGTTTDVKGEFKILAKPGDSIFFSSVQFENRNFVVTDTSFKASLKIRLIEKFNELDEVQLDDIKLSGVLSQDLDRVPKSIYEKLGMPFPKPRRTSLAMASQSAGADPISLLVNILNGKVDELKKANEHNRAKSLVDKALLLAGGDSYFISQLQLSQKEILNFLFFCKGNEKFESLVKAENALGLLEYFKTQLDSFKELREIE